MSAITYRKLGNGYAASRDGITVTVTPAWRRVGGDGWEVAEVLWPSGAPVFAATRQAACEAAFRLIKFPARVTA